MRACASPHQAIHRDGPNLLGCVVGEEIVLRDVRKRWRPGGGPLPGDRGRPAAHLEGMAGARRALRGRRDRRRRREGRGFRY